MRSMENKGSPALPSRTCHRRTKSACALLRSLASTRRLHPLSKKVSASSSVTVGLAGAVKPGDAPDSCWPGDCPGPGDAAPRPPAVGGGRSASTSSPSRQQLICLRSTFAMCLRSARRRKLAVSTVSLEPARLANGDSLTGRRIPKFSPESFHLLWSPEPFISAPVVASLEVRQPWASCDC
jgi:hypothetical protein